MVHVATCVVHNYVNCSVVQWEVGCAMLSHIISDDSHVHAAPYTARPLAQAPHNVMHSAYNYSE